MWRVVLFHLLLCFQCRAAPAEFEDLVQANLSAVWSEIRYLRQELADHHHDGHLERDHDTIVTDVGVMQHEHHIHHHHTEDDASEMHPLHHLHHSHAALQHLDSDHGHDVDEATARKDKHDEHDLHGDGQEGHHDHSDEHEHYSAHEHEEEHEHNEHEHEYHAHENGPSDLHEHEHHVHEHGHGNLHEHEHHVHEHGHGDQHEHEHHVHGHGDQHEHEYHVHESGHGNEHKHHSDHEHDDEHSAYVIVTNEIHDDSVEPFNSSSHAHHDRHHHRVLGRDDPHHPANQPPGTLAQARCILAPNTQHATSEVAGNITLYQRSDGEGPVYFDIQLGGFEGEGLYGFHVHQKRVVDGDCGTAGGHFNPHGVVHGAPTADVRHTADLGNLEVGPDGVVSDYLVVDHRAAFDGEDNILRRSIVIHAGEDDLGLGGDEGSAKTGNAGPRLACCNIAVVPTFRFRFGG